MTESDGVEVNKMDGISSFEKLISIGYDSQKQKFSGVVVIKDASIFDDYEHVLICTEFEGIMTPLRRGALHVINERTGLVNPPGFSV